LILSQNTTDKQKFFEGKDKSSILVINLDGLEFQGVDIDRPDEEMKDNQQPIINYNH